MIVYEWVDHTEDSPEHYFTTLTQARNSLKEHLRTGWDGDFCHGSTLGPIDIVRVDVGVTTKERVVAMLNHEGFVVESTVIERWKAVPCNKCEGCREFGGHDCQRKKVVLAPGKS